jgi:hypothetical protein
MNPKNLIKIILFNIICYTNAFSQEKLLPPSEMIANSVIRLVGSKDTIINGKVEKQFFMGTGFFLEFKSGSKRKICIVSNKHVVENMDVGYLLFNKAMDDSLPNYGDTNTIIINDFNKKWIFSDSVDLAILPADDYLKLFEKKWKKRAYYNYFPEEILPSNENIQSIQFFEELLMIGYPSGIMDQKNNLPIFRKGYSATPYKFNFNGEKIMLADIPDFEGSSGSPVLLYSDGPYSPSGKYYNEFFEQGLRVILLGINKGTYYNISTHNIFINQNGVVSGTPLLVNNKTYLNLGIVIKSEALLEFKAKLFK